MSEEFWKAVDRAAAGRERLRQAEQYTEKVESELATLRAKLADRDAEVAGLREALKPFAILADTAGELPDRAVIFRCARGDILATDLRQARQALASPATAAQGEDGAS